MTLNLLKLPALLMALALTACSSTEELERIPDKSAADLYLDAKAEIASGNNVSAATVLETLSSRFPFGAHAIQVQLDLIYVYYKTEDYAQGIATVDRFIRLNPTHPDLDWVLYMRGLMNEQAHDEFFHRLLGVDRSTRDPSQLEAAFSDFKRLLTDYPASRYAADARQRLINIKQSLANYELEVARFYIERKAYVAAANRGQHILRYFGDTPQAAEALGVMREAYAQLGMSELEREAALVAAHNGGDG